MRIYFLKQCKYKYATKTCHGFGLVVPCGHCCGYWCQILGWWRGSNFLIHFHQENILCEKRFSQFTAVLCSRSYFQLFCVGRQCWRKYLSQTRLWSHVEWKRIFTSSDNQEKSDAEKEPGKLVKISQCPF